PETERLLRWDPRPANEVHVSPAQRRWATSGEQVPANRTACHRDPPRVAGEIPRLCVELVEEQRVALAGPAEGIEDRKLRVLGESAVEGGEGVARVGAGHDRLAEQIAVGLAGSEEMLAEPVDVLGPCPRHQEHVSVADRFGAERGQA